jgi:hypothetical protein
MSGSGGDNAASTSASTGLLSEEVRRELDAIFNWNPRHLHLGSPVPTPTTKATATHSPWFYDRHLGANLILRHVKHLPSLVPSLVNNVDDLLRAVSPTLPRIWDLPTAEQRRKLLKFDDGIAEDEKAVVEAYNNTVPTFCNPVASTLALHPKASASEWSSLLKWTTSVHPSGYAIADGQLRIRYSKDAASLLNSMDSDTRTIVEKMKNDRSSLATWEFKSLTTGIDDVMKAVGTLGEFSWTGCDPRKCSKKKHRIWTKEVRKAKVGPDAKHPPWNVNVCAFTPTSVDVADYSTGPIC